VNKAEGALMSPDWQMTDEIVNDGTIEIYA